MLLLLWQELSIGSMVKSWHSGPGPVKHLTDEEVKAALSTPINCGLSCMHGCMQNKCASVCQRYNNMSKPKPIICMHACRQLRDQAFSKGSTDNISVALLRVRRRGSGGASGEGTGQAQ